MDYQELTARHGAFTAHNFRIEGVEGGYTLGDRPTGDDEKVYRVTQIASDFAGGDLAGMRVLDIAGLEGIYAIELALRGASVTLVEIREANIEKARFAAEAFGVSDRIEFVEADILETDLGMFDIVLCLGIFYHFDKVDTFRFAEKVMAALKPGGCVIVDTFISLFPHAIYKYGGKAYFGNPWMEHLPWTSAARKKAKLWQSLKYNTAVYLTRESVARLFSNLGCTTFHECLVPGEPRKSRQRATFVGVKGSVVHAGANPWIDRCDRRIPERNPLGRILQLFAGERS